jgi:hypothetical protein
LQAAPCAPCTGSTMHFDLIANPRGMSWFSGPLIAEIVVELDDGLELPTEVLMRGEVSGVQ